MATKAQLEKLPSQRETDAVWRAEWAREIDAAGIRNLVRQRLFVEGYPVFKRHIPEEAQTILDVGSGTGRYGVMFAKDFPGVQVTVTDILEEALDVGRALAAELGVTNVTFAKEDALRMSFPDGSFDVVFCDVVLQHIPNNQNVLKEMLRVLKPGGTLIVSSVNTWNLPHTAYKGLLRMIGRPYSYGYEETFSPRSLKRFLERHLMRVVAVDGFYFAYGIYRLKVHHPFFAILGKIANRATKALDAVSGRAISRYFGFETFCVARKHLMKVEHSGYVRLPSFEDTKEGMLMAVEFAKALPFEPKRVYVLSNVNDYHTVRGGHAHRALDQVIFCLAGSFELRLDDGKTYQKIMMRSNGYGIRLKPMLWHSMRKFSRDCVILVFASAPYDESDYIRDHAEFLRLANNSDRA